MESGHDHRSISQAKAKNQNTNKIKAVRFWQSVTVWYAQKHFCRQTGATRAGTPISPVSKQPAVLLEARLYTVLPRLIEICVLCSIMDKIWVYEIYRSLYCVFIYIPHSLNYLFGMGIVKWYAQYSKSNYDSVILWIWFCRTFILGIWSTIWCKTFVLFGYLNRTII